MKFFERPARTLDKMTCHNFLFTLNPLYNQNNLPKNPEQYQKTNNIQKTFDKYT